MRRVVAVGAAAAVLMSCGGSGGPSGRAFHSVKQMVAAMQTGGVVCAALHASNDRLATQAGHCRVGGRSVNLDIYGSQDARDRAVALAKRLVTSGAVLIGPNWTVGAVGGTARAAMARIRSAIGGRIESL
jgi:hypothetical protein